MRFHPSSRRGRFVGVSAFTLVEILLVVTIIIILSAAGSAIPGALASQRLSFAARQLSADLNQAALLARKENRVVELRFYLMQSALEVGESMAYRAYQVGTVTGWNAKGDPITEFPAEVTRLPEDVVFIPDEEYNSLHKLEVIKNDDVNMVDGASYVNYFVQSNGSTTLPQAESAVITLVREKAGNIPTTLPADYRSVVINPQTHQSRVY